MVLFFAVKDWANMGWMLSRSLREVGVDSEAVTIHETGFKYPEMPHVISGPEEANKYLDRAEVVVLMHSHPALLSMPYNLRKKRVAVFHGGTEYREKPNDINELFNDLIYVSVVQTGNLLGLGAKNENWVLPPIDLDYIKPLYPENKKVIIGHFPRSPIVKGSEQINRVMERLKNKFDFEYFYSNTRVDWPESLRRMSRCDIYICAMKPELNGKPYGGGIEVTDLESMALGNITISHFRDIERYKKEFGECALRVANTPQGLEDRLSYLLSLSTDEQRVIKESTRAWVEKNHSYKAVGERLKGVLGV